MKIDALCKKFYGESAVFAEVCNLAFYKGRPVVKHEDLTAMPTEMSAVLGDSPATQALNRRRDLMMEWGPGGPRLPVKGAILSTWKLSSNLKKGDKS